MNDVKLSKYLHICETDNELLAVNFLTGGIIIFEGALKNTAKQYFEEFPNRQEWIYEKDLFNKQILISSAINEEAQLQEVKNKVINQTDTLSLIIFVTEQCNFRCKYCCETFQNGNISQDIMDKIISFLCDHLFHYKKLHIDWFGGEPLLAINEITYLSNAILGLCKKYHVRYHSSITTNAYFLNSKTLLKLKNLHILNYQITVDGLKNVHDRQRVLLNQNGTWDTIIHNLRDIRDNTKSNTFNIMIRTNISKNIQNEYKEYIDFLNKEFGKDRRFHFLWKLAEDWGNIDEETKEMLCGIEAYKDVVHESNSKKLRSRMLSISMKAGGRICETSKKNALVIFSNGVIGKCARNECPEKSHLGTIDDLINNPSVMLNATAFRIKSGCHGCDREPLCLDASCPYAEASPCGFEMDDINFMLSTIAISDDLCTRFN